MSIYIKVRDWGNGSNLYIIRTIIVVIVITSVSFPFPGVGTFGRYDRNFALAMDQRVAIDQKGLPVFSLAGWRSSFNSFVEVIEDNFFVLLQKFVAEFGQDLQEGQVGGRGRGVVGVLQGVDGQKDSFAM